MEHRVRLGPIAVFLTIVTMVITTLAVLTVATSNADRVMAGRFARITQTRYELEADGERFLAAVAGGDISEIEGAVELQGGDISGIEGAAELSGDTITISSGDEVADNEDSSELSDNVTPENDDTSVKADDATLIIDDAAETEGTAELSREGVTASTGGNATESDVAASVDGNDVTGRTAGGRYSYTQEKDGYRLEVEVSGIREDGTPEVSKWKLSRIWQSSDPINDIWQGF